jgi:hypothetical protein
MFKWLTTLYFGDNCKLFAKKTFRKAPYSNIPLNSLKHDTVSDNKPTSDRSHGSPLRGNTYLSFPRWA